MDGGKENFYSYNFTKAIYMTRNIWIGIVVVIVLVAGGWWYLNQSSPVSTLSESPNLQEVNTAQQPPTTYTPQTPPRPSQPSTATVSKLGWKTYTNDRYGFEFQYPADFTLRVEEQGGTYIGVAPDFPAVGFYVTGADGKTKLAVLVSPTTLSPEAVIKQIQDATDSAEGMPSASLVVTGTRTVSNEHAVIERQGIYVAHNGYIYLLTQASDNPNPWLGGAPPSEEILATFQFTR